MVNISWSSTLMPPYIWEDSVYAALLFVLFECMVGQTLGQQKNAFMLAFYWVVSFPCIEKIPILS